MTSTKDATRMLSLVKGRHTCLFVSTFEEDEALSLCINVAIECGRDPWCWSIDRGVYDGVQPGGEGVKDTAHPAAALTWLADRRDAKMCVLLDMAGHLDDARTLRALRVLLRRAAAQERTIVLIDHASELPSVIAAHATRFEPSFPDETEISQTIRDTLRTIRSRRELSVEVSKPQWRMILKNLGGLTRRQIERIVVDTVIEDGRFSDEDMNHLLALRRQTLGADGLLEYVETPVDLSQIGGLSEMKRWLTLRQGALTNEAAAQGLPHPRGMLLLGVQGAGKSLSAKAVATAWQRPLLRLDPSVLYDRFIGESEKKLREALRQAEAMAPIVLWIDEIEKGFSSAASHNVDGGLSRRMFGSLLTWMQDHTAPVFIVATANDIEALPPELLRKGRFDEIFFVDLPSREVRKTIFEIHLKKRNRDAARFDLDALADASQGYSGAEIEQAIIAAMYEAFGDKCEMSMVHLLKAVAGSPPLSVTMAEKIAMLRSWAKKRCVPAD